MIWYYGWIVSAWNLSYKYMKASVSILMKKKKLIRTDNWELTADIFSISILLSCNEQQELSDNVINFNYTLGLVITLS
jgi:hypothetical protein